MRRRITWGARLRILLHARDLGHLVQMLWLCLLLAPVTFLVHARHWHLDRVAVGHVDKVARAKRKSQSDRFHAYGSFADERGIEHPVASYFDAPVVDAEVTVHYEHDDPSHAVIDGGHVELESDQEQQVAITMMAVFGIISVAASLLVGGRTLRLLRRGTVTSGSIVSRREGRRTRLGRIQIFTFEYDVPGGGKHQRDISTLSPQALTDAPAKTILFDADRPERATTLDQLPGSPQLLPDGTIASRGGGEAAFVIPVLAIAAWLVAIGRVVSWYA